MKRKKSTSLNAKKETAHREEKKLIPTWISFRLLILLLLLLAGIVWFGFYATHTKEVAGSDDREYTSIARNIVNGKGIVRNFVYPLDINFFEKLPIPEFVHPPVHPLILAGFFKLIGISDFSALLPSYLSYFILILLFFFFVKRYLEVKTAVIATVVLIFNREILEMSLVALSEGVYTLLFFIFFSLFVKANSLKAIFISGILLGISHLIRENIYPFLIPLFVYLYFFPNLTRWKKMTFFVIGILIPLIPNILRSFFDTGSLFFSYGKFTLMAYTAKYPFRTRPC
jgi:4-amino-4-deoxy-L-arabinose transferase-like glycosyltransferase